MNVTFKEEVISRVCAVVFDCNSFCCQIQIKILLWWILLTSLVVWFYEPQNLVLCMGMNHLQIEYQS